MGSYQLAVFLVLFSSLLGISSSSSPTCNITSLTDYLQISFDSIENGKEHMTCIKEYFLQNNDRRAFFVSIYVAVTTGVEQAIQNNIFHNGPWMGYYDYQFANFYRKALLNWEQGNKASVPMAWSMAFDAAANNDGLLIIQHALLGINAHIDNDLAQVIAMLNITTDTEVKHSDSLLVNDVILSVYNSIIPGLVELYAPAMNLTVFEPQLFNIVKSLESGLREDAWEFAFKLVNATTLQHMALVEQLNVKAAADAQEVISMTGIDPSLAKQMRQLEGDQFKAFCGLVDWAC